LRQTRRSDEPKAIASLIVAARIATRSAGEPGLQATVPAFVAAAALSVTEFQA